MLHHRAADRGELLAEQLQATLHHRVVVEQAKGVLAEYGGLDMHDAFTRLREYAHQRQHQLSDVARDLAGETSSRGPRHRPLLTAHPGNRQARRRSASCDGGPMMVNNSANLTTVGAPRTSDGGINASSCSGRPWRISPQSASCSSGASNAATGSPDSCRPR
ncbi:ANTAR domain-containing protein [Amycolatopsis sp. cmx-4-61]|uniref:ANTAR domain-containing protein n=1 Tax=Amycolatopsis sp. cmx-4-61 TaxID=2790937 RepID=UPI0039793D85